ncbi:hypothetical protein BDV59DRAFT_570 [Aspergillus ambiguus]|uniref:RTP1/Tango6 family protein n=1 Tax=Aspergillus ambiguus TaxID=176160 RepID=UPI003CCD7F6F
MGEPRQVKAAFNAANEFLTPVLQREEIQKARGNSLVEILSKDLLNSPENESVRRRLIIERAVEILFRIHLSFVTPVNDATSHTVEETEDPALEDAKRRRLLHALLDLISLEGIYPSQSFGVGIPLQQRVISVLPAGVIAQQQQNPAHDSPQDVSLLDYVLQRVTEILLDARPSIQPVIRGRILSDVISGTTDLAFNSKTLSSDRKEWYYGVLTKVIEETSSPVLLSTLSSFLQSDTASWFKAIISAQLSRVPLRQDGVLQTIIFLASQFSPSLGNDSQAQTSNGPHFTVQAIMQTSRLLSSVPQGMDPREYFTAIAPQLLSLIDGDDPDLRKTAAYAVGNGILCKRQYGAPGTIGYSIFLEPIFKTLTAALDNLSREYMRFHPNPKELSSEKVLVDENMLYRAVDRLRSLVLQPPNPSLVKRVVYPILLPLWGLACFATQNEKLDLHEKIMTVLHTYFGISVGLQPWTKLVDNLLWDGGATWTYSLELDDRVSLVKRSPGESGGVNVVQLVDTLQTRAEVFIKTLEAEPSSEERTADIFLYVSERWLVRPSTREEVLGRSQLSQETDSFQNMQRQLVSAKLAEALLNKFKDSLSRRPLRVLELIKQIINAEYSRLGKRSPEASAHNSGSVSLSSLANIVPSQETEEEHASNDDTAETLPAVFSLLSTILASPEFSATLESIPLLQNIKDTLDKLIPHLPSSLAKPGTTATMLLEIHISSPEEHGSQKSSSETSDFDIHRRALTNLNSELPPVQAEGFSLLSDLIKKASPVLDIPSTLTLLLSILTDSSETAASDEFIYLNAIKLIGTLASRHPRTVIKTLVDRYTDRSEQATLDQRLKIGESILRTVQDLGEALTGETAKILGEGVIAVAGRRALKPQAQKNRRQQLEKEKREKERELRKKQRESAMPEGWKISSPALMPDQEAGDDDSDQESPEQATHSANIVAAWAAGAASDEEPEDLRVRASALSVLATAVQTNIAGLGASVVGSAVDLAISTLMLEPEDESAILRRASVVLLLDVLKAFDAAREARGSNALGFGFSLSDDAPSGSHWKENLGGSEPTSVGNIPHMLRSLHFVESRETDSIVRGHIRVLIESLEAWLEKSLLWGIGTREDDNEPRMELGDRLAGLQVDPLAERTQGRPRIEEIE